MQIKKNSLTKLNTDLSNDIKATTNNTLTPGKANHSMFNSIL